jgi:cell division protein FtsL
MKNLKFVLLVVVLLAAIPTVFFAQIKRNTPTIQDQQEQVLEDKKNSALSCGENYISVLTVSIAY